MLTFPEPEVAGLPVNSGERLFPLYDYRQEAIDLDNWQHHVTRDIHGVGDTGDSGITSTDGDVVEVYDAASVAHGDDDVIVLTDDVMDDHDDVIAVGDDIMDDDIIAGELALSDALFLKCNNMISENKHVICRDVLFQSLGNICLEIYCGNGNTSSRNI